jgi:flagellar protein FlaH
MPAPKGQILLSTDNPEIDKKLGGGIPSGSLVLVEGQSDSGKSVFVQQIMWGALKAGMLVTLFTTENTVKSLVRQMQSLNQDITDYLLLGRLKAYMIKAAHGKVYWEKSLEDLLAAIHTQKERDLVVIDSITSFIVHSHEEEVIAFFEECKIACSGGLTIIMVTHPHAFSESLLVRIISLCDAHLHLGVETLGERVVRMLVAAKVRGAEQSTGNVVTFDVEPGWGIRVIPFTKAKA